MGTLTLRLPEQLDARLTMLAKLDDSSRSELDCGSGLGLFPAAPLAAQAMLNKIALNQGAPRIID